MSQRRSFTRRDALLFAGLGVAATLLTPARLFADPQSDLEAASAQLDSLGAALAEAMDNLNEKTYALDATNNKIGEVQEQIAETTNQLNQQRLVLSAAMRSAYKAGPQETLDFLLGASSPEDFVSRVYYMDRTSKQEADSINTVKALGDQLQAQQLELQAEQENLQAQVAEMKTTADGLQSQVAEAKAYYDSLDAEVKAQLAAQEAASANNNVAYAIETVTRENPSNSSESNDSPSNSSNSSSSNSSNSSSSSNSGSGSNSSSGSDSGSGSHSSGGGGGYPAAGGGVATAYACIGYPYVWGGASPASGFDCGGLVYYCFLGYRAGTAGTIGRAIRAAGNWHDSMDELNYGDIIFTRAGYEHVGIYIGGGRMIHAANESVGVIEGPVYACYGGGPFSG